MTYPAGIIVNKATGRFHPVVFRFSPLPSMSDDLSGVHRHKSIGHHTKGFDTKEEAEAHIKGDANQRFTDAMFEWDGEGIPAIVHFFEVTP